MNHYDNPEHFGRPKFRSKNRTRDGFVVRDVSVRKLNRKWSVVQVPKVGWMKFRRDRTLGGHGMAHVTRNRRGQWHVSFSAPQTPVEPEPGRDRNAVGVDRGVTTTVATSDEDLLDIPLPTDEEVKRLKRLQRKQARQKPGSARRRRTKAAIAKLHGVWADRRKDWVEQTSTMLVANNYLIVFEDLETKQMMKSASGTVENPGVNVAAKSALNERIAQSCWGMLEVRTRQKAEASDGVLVIKVNAAYTSQTCNRCQHVCAENRNGKLFVCVQCGHTNDADINAAENILAAGLVVIGCGVPNIEANTSTVTMKRQPSSTLCAA